MSDPIAAYSQELPLLAITNVNQYLAAISAPSNPIAAMGGGQQGIPGPRNATVTVDATDDVVMAPWTTYKADDPDDVVLFNLPLDASSNIGDPVSILGYGLGGWKIIQRAGEQILLSGSTNQTIAGVTGNLYSANPNDSADLFKIAPNTWLARVFGCGINE